MIFNQPNKFWHTLSVEETLALEEVTVDQGLTGYEAKKRIEEYGPNELIEKGVKSPWKILLDQFRETMVVVFIIILLLSTVVFWVVEIEKWFLRLGQKIT